MNRVEFIQELERLLMDIPENDRMDAIAYYQDYFDEAGADNEAQVIRELGSPEKVADTIKAGFTNTSARQEASLQEKKKKRDFPLALIIILVIFASPLLVGVGGGAFGIILGVLGVVFGIIVAVIVTVFAVAVAMLACGVACVVAGAACIVVGLMRAVTSTVEGLVLVGVGGITFSIGVLFTILFVWCAFKWLPMLFRWTIDLIQRLFRRRERRSRA